MGAAILEPGRMDTGLAYFFRVFPGVAFFLRQRAEGETLGEGPVGIPGAILPSSGILQRSREPGAASSGVARPRRDVGVPGRTGDERRAPPSGRPERLQRQAAGHRARSCYPAGPAPGSQGSGPWWPPCLGGTRGVETTRQEGGRGTQPGQGRQAFGPPGLGWPPCPFPKELEQDRSGRGPWAQGPQPPQAPLNIRTATVHANSKGFCYCGWGRSWDPDVPVSCSGDHGWSLATRCQGAWTVKGSWEAAG